MTDEPTTEAKAVESAAALEIKARNKQDERSHELALVTREREHQLALRQTMLPVFERLPVETRMWLDPDMATMMEAAVDRLAKSPSMPEHLRGDHAACFDLLGKSLTTRLPPLVIAQGQVVTHKGARPTYFGSLIIAIINASPRVSGNVRWEYLPDEAAWNRQVQGKHKTMKSTRKTDEHGNAAEYEVATYTREDEKGLGLRVFATIDGEEREHEVWMADCHPRFSTLWATNPKMQIVYRGARDFGRARVPEIMAGVRTEDDEDARPPMRDITPAAPAQATERPASTGFASQVRPQSPAEARQQMAAAQATETPDGEPAAPSGDEQGDDKVKEWGFPGDPDHFAKKRLHAATRSPVLQAIAKDWRAAKERMNAALAEDQWVQQAMAAAMAKDPDQDDPEIGEEGWDATKDADGEQTVSWHGLALPISTAAPDAICTEWTRALESCRTLDALNDLVATIEPTAIEVPKTLADRMGEITWARRDEIDADADDEGELR